MKFHSHEETDNLIVLQSIDVAKSNPFCQLYVAFPDTDVLLLLLQFYRRMCNNTIFHAITREINVGCAYKALGNEKSKALLGVHAFTGCDLKEDLVDFQKPPALIPFLKAIQSYIKHLLHWEIMTMV